MKIFSAFIVFTLLCCGCVELTGEIDQDARCQDCDQDEDDGGTYYVGDPIGTSDPLVQPALEAVLQQADGQQPNCTTGHTPNNTAEFVQCCIDRPSQNEMVSKTCCGFIVGQLGPPTCNQWYVYRFPTYGAP